MADKVARHCHICGTVYDADPDDDQYCSRHCSNEAKKIREAGEAGPQRTEKDGEPSKGARGSKDTSKDEEPAQRPSVARGDGPANHPGTSGAVAPGSMTARDPEPDNSKTAPRNPPNPGDVGKPGGQNPDLGGSVPPRGDVRHDMTNPQLDRHPDTTGRAKTER